MPFIGKHEPFKVTVGDVRVQRFQNIVTGCPVLREQARKGISQPVNGPGLRIKPDPVQIGLSTDGVEIPVLLEVDFLSLPVEIVLHRPEYTGSLFLHLL